jgi:periplasmic protein TonB
VVSGAAHVFLGLALSIAVWRTASDEPLPATLTMVFEVAGKQPETAVEPEASAPPAASEEPPQPLPAKSEPVRAEQQPEPPQAEPPQAEPPQAEPWPVQPVQAEPPPAELPQVEQSLPEVPPQPRPVAPAPPPPAPLPHAKSLSKQVAARVPLVKPVSPKPGSANTAPVPSVPSLPPAGVAGQPAEPGGAIADPQWNGLFAAWLAARKTYPEAARRRGEQGSVTLRFTVAGDGTVLQVALVTGSGSRVLDAAAQALLSDAKLPAPQTEISRTVRVQYRLGD